MSERKRICCAQCGYSRALIVEKSDDDTVNVAAIDDGWTLVDIEDGKEWKRYCQQCAQSSEG